MPTRIYQGRILSAHYATPEAVCNGISAKDSLIYTFRLFQDAVNYHLVALAGMANPHDGTITASFRKQVESIWSSPPREKSEAQTLQQSLCRTLNLPPNASFDDAVQVIFETVTKKELLPYVLQLIVERIASGDIQKGSKDLLPKLCDSNFSGNYDYSRKEQLAKAGLQKLKQKLSSLNGKDNQPKISEQELVALAAEMDLSWSGIKTLVKADQTHPVLYSPEETAEKVKEATEALYIALKNKTDSVWNKLEDKENLDLAEFVHNTLKNTKPAYSANHCLAKDAIGAIKPNNRYRKLAAIFFMYYPSVTSAKMLLEKLPNLQSAKKSDSLYDFSKLDNDPFIICRGETGYIYRGFSALPEWESETGHMYSRSWDILAFSEAIKTLHSFDNKTEERKKHLAELEQTLRYMEGDSRKPADTAEEEETPLPVLGGDPRFLLLNELIKEIAPVGYDDYFISSRALRHYDEIVKLWLKAEKECRNSEKELIDIVRNEQSHSTNFGSGILFEALCKKKYRAIWHAWEDTSKTPKPRSQNILNDFNRWQELKQEIEQYKRPVRITAAEAEASPRQLLFSELSKLGPSSKGHEFVEGKNGIIKLSSIIRNSKGHLEATNINIRYSAPRFERDELGTDAAFWPSNNKSDKELTSWLQPMMKALQINPDLLHMDGPPAVGLQVKQYRDKKGNLDSVCLLNFPVSFEFAPIHNAIGKAAIWNNQMLRSKKENLHLHWPATYASKSEPWWLSPNVTKEGVNILGIDLGVRYAAAWSLVHMQNSPEMLTSKGTKRSGRLIGHAGDNNWYGFCIKSGLIKIDGEGNGQPKDKNDYPLPAGVGMPTPQDLELASQILSYTGHMLQKPEKLNVLQLGDIACTQFQRLLSRCRRYQSLLVKFKDEDKRAQATEEALDYFNYNEQTKKYIPDIIASLKANDVKTVSDKLLEATYKLRKLLPQAAEDLTNLLLPRKQGKWVWAEDSKPGYVCSGRMVLAEADNSTRRVFHRGGLSVSRLTQLENLRRHLQSMNRILWATPGEKVEFGASYRNIKVIDPCPDLLRKIENVREQRVNKIAHEITAQALGLRLKNSRSNKNPDGRDIVHGEYERLPNRHPVDFVILENLSRYRTSIDRTPHENSTLMRWAHRQIVAKVKQLLEEVFGIPVLCTHSAYTSKFDALSSRAGFRAVEMTSWRLDALKEKKNDGLTVLAGIYKQLLEMCDRKDGMKLLMPGKTNSGEYFLSPAEDGVRATNADINASINIAWRGIAAPEALHLLHRVRLSKKKGKLLPVNSNKREKALEKSWTFEMTDPNRETNDFSAAFWIPENSPVPILAQYKATQADNACTLAHGKDLWGYIKKQHWQLCHLFNIRTLKKAGVNVNSLTNYLSKQELLSDDDSDIPL